MKRICTILLAAALAGCATTETATQPPAAVEDRAGTTKPGAGPGASGVPEKPVTGVDLTGGKPAGADPLKDPSSPLSMRSIYYDFDKYDIKDEYKPVIEAHARYLRENGGVKMLIQGNTDERGSREYNIALGQRRAESVKKMLLLLGAREEQVEAVSLGEEKPKETGHGEEAWTRNRRSDMLYAGEY
ncbi:MAG: peptidoglycan-associated lipoprotein Pal [Betaproteobacteria bacterium]|nr:peptidoglycan-associated lipoprotein Pal [Betaproteobacteria bacterium]MDH5220873.1 peptidoglycan-associated lipoprotein Pal [Betaproteobacteria bacterium]MDH5349251.1 peptidoglycan-associated lipoprotein Pal [Betaproteobacteria bacterium]